MATSTTLVTCSAERLCDETRSTHANSGAIRILRSHKWKFPNSSSEKRCNRRPTRTTVDPVRDETRYAQANSGAIRTLRSHKWKFPNASSQKRANCRPTRTTAIPPTTSMHSSDCKRMPTTFDDNEVKPISLDDFDEITQNRFIQIINVELIQELSFDSDCGNRSYRTTVESVDIPIKYSIEDENNNDDGNEQDWAKKIAAIAESSGNLIEDLECDESSTSSMTTIIDSEQSSSADVDDDLENIFRLEDEMDEGENDDCGNDRGNVDPLHSSCFVIFGDDYDGRKVSNKNDDRENIDSRSIISEEKIPPTRPKTSRINPMTGERSKTDDMHEWRKMVISSWTVTKPEKKIYITRNAKREIATGQHKNSLRKGTDRTKTVAAADVLESITKNPFHKRSRELSNIASFNLPGMSDAYGEYHMFSAATNQKKVDAEKVPDFKFVPKCNLLTNNRSCVGKRLEHCNSNGINHTGGKHLVRQGESENEIVVPPFPTSKKFTNKARIGDAIRVPEDEKEDGLQVSARIIESHESSKNLPASDNSQRFNKITFPLPSSAIDDEKNKIAIGNIRLRTSNDGQSSSQDNARLASSIKDQDLSPQRGGGRKSNRGLRTTAVTCRPTFSRIAKNNISYTTETYTEDLSRSANRKRKQKINNCRWSEPQSMKPSRKRNEASLNVETSNGSTRIAKRFKFNPTRSKGNDKLKTYFGTVDSKRIEEEADGNCVELWHVVYDDGDEEDFDVTQLKEALDLYNIAKRWDKKDRDKRQTLKPYHK